MISKFESELNKTSLKKHQQNIKEIIEILKKSIKIQNEAILYLEFSHFDPY